MIIQKILAKNFKGLESLEYNLNGQSVEILGDNATGKTSIMDGYLWLLFGKDSLNRADFEIKPLDLTGQPIHNQRHEVECQFTDPILNLRKVLVEKWTKKRGSTDKELTGHVTEYFIDDVPVKKNEFDAKVATIADEATFRLLSNPRYFSEFLSWQQRRAILVESFGGLDNEDVYAAFPKLAELKDLLAGKTPEQQRTILQLNRKDVVKELEQIPVRIAELQRSAGEIDGKSIEELTQALEEARKLREFALEAVTRHRSGGEIAEKTKQLREIEIAILEAKNAAILSNGGKARELQQNINAARQALSVKLQEFAELQSKKQETDDRIVSLETRLKDLRQQWIDVDTLKAPGNGTCPTCQQRLPEDQILEALSKFNLDKSSKLTKIRDEGHKAKEELAQAVQAQKDLTDELEAVSKVIETVQINIAGLEKEQTTATATPITLEVPAGLLEAEEKVEKELSDLRLSASDAIGHAESELKATEALVVAIEEEIGSIKGTAQTQNRIEELKAQEKSLAAQYEVIEKHLYLINEFLVTKVRMLENHINQQFRQTTFKLFDPQLNGGVSECCEILHQGVPYGSMNNAARINCGLDVINTLSGVYGIRLPVFIDNSESVTSLLSVPNQMICLKVSADHKELTIQPFNN